MLVYRTICFHSTSIDTAYFQELQNGYIPPTLQILQNKVFNFTQILNWRNKNTVHKINLLFGAYMYAFTTVVLSNTPDKRRPKIMYDQIEKKMIDWLSKTGVFYWPAQNYKILWPHCPQKDRLLSRESLWQAKKEPIDRKDIAPSAGLTKSRTGNEAIDQAFDHYKWRIKKCRVETGVILIKTI